MLEYQQKKGVFFMNYKLIQYNDENFRLVEYKNSYNYWSDKLKNKSILGSGINDRKQERIDNVIRSKNAVKSYCLANKFNFFVTITVDTIYDRYNVDFLYNEIREKCKKIKRKYKDFIYLFIIEEHKNGAFHSHGVVYLNDFAQHEYLTSKVVKNKQNKFIHCYENCIFNTIGFNTFDKIKSNVAISNYIIKYIQKDPCKTSSNRLYFCSRGLAKEQKEYLQGNEIDTIFNNKKIFENNYVKVLDFNINDLSKEEIVLLMHAEKCDVAQLEKQYWKNKVENFIDKFLK